MRTQKLELTLRRMYHMSNRPCIQGNYGTLGLQSALRLGLALEALELGLALEALGLELLSALLSALALVLRTQICTSQGTRHGFAP